MKQRYPLVMLLPIVILFGVVFMLPTVQGFLYSFTHWNIFEARFAGLTNYKNILFDKNLNSMISNTFIFAFLTTILKVTLGLLLAVLVNRKIKSKNYLRTVYFIPAILSPVAVGIIFTGMMHPTNGLINVFLNTVGLDFLTKSWLTDIQVALYSVILIEVWQWTGFTMLIFLSGLQAIPESFYEAADIDGASPFKKFTHVTMPLIMPSFNNALVLSIIGGLKVFGIIYATTQGGPGNTTQVFGTFIFKSFSAGRYGEAAAASIIQSIFIAIFALTTMNFIRKKEVEL